MPHRVERLLNLTIYDHGSVSQKVRTRIAKDGWHPMRLEACSADALITTNPQYQFPKTMYNRDVGLDGNLIRADRVAYGKSGTVIAKTRCSLCARKRVE